jgi:hypothetical protein
MLFLIARLDAAGLRLDPDLQEVHGALLGTVELAVANAGAGGHALHVARTDHRTIAHRILVRQFPVEDIADDLHVTVSVGTEAGTRLHAILIDHAQRTHPHALGVVVVGKGEGVKALEPTVVGPAAFVAASNLVHGRLPFRQATLCSIL